MTKPSMVFTDIDSNNDRSGKHQSLVKPPTPSTNDARKLECSLNLRALMWLRINGATHGNNDPSSANPPARRQNCCRDAMAGWMQHIAHC